MDVELRYLAAFAAVCEEGGFGRAARKLHVSQPAVSYQVKRLEEQLGVQLLERAGRNLILTAEGKLLKAYCRRFFAEFAHLRSRFQHSDLSLAEPLHIASVSGFGRYVLFPLLCREEYRHLRFDVRFPLEDDVLLRVERGHSDLGFVYETRVSNYLQFHPVYLEELVLVAGSKFPTQAVDFRKLQTFASLAMITYEEGHYVFGRWFESQFQAQPPSTLSMHHFEELEEVLEMVRLGRGLSILPDHVVREAARNSTVQVIRPFSNRKCTNMIFAVTRSGALIRKEVEKIIPALRELQEHQPE